MRCRRYQDVGGRLRPNQRLFGARDFDDQLLFRAGRLDPADGRGRGPGEKLPVSGKQQQGLGKAKSVERRPTSPNGFRRQRFGTRKALARTGHRQLESGGAQGPANRRGALQGLHQHLSDLAAAVKAARAASRGKKEHTVNNFAARRNRKGRPSPYQLEQAHRLLRPADGHGAPRGETQGSGNAGDAQNLRREIAVGNILGKPTLKPCVGQGTRKHGQSNGCSLLGTSGFVS
jgi:hypothetical protein